ncbi:MAG TPA: hypothetical protein VMH81_09365 [Bryobacteraceae bacterium]|nr:hypothetical protein [Bryobacteraceae bacterium]
MSTRSGRLAPAVAWFAACLFGLTLAGAPQLPFEPAHDSGQSITGAFEGWFTNPDGSVRILVGYYNRNLKQELDIPPGPNNRVEPGGPDQGQPTHFLAGRQWGIFTITPPKDLGEKRLTWTLVANGQTTVIPLNLNPLWELSPFVDANGNTPPFIGFAETGPFVNGPGGQSIAMNATVPEPLPLTIWVADDAHPPTAGPVPRIVPVTVAWSKFRGPGSVKFANDRPRVEKAEFQAPPPAKFSGKASTTATFSEPGEYILRVVANDWSGEGGRGFQCCWSNAQVKVSVK